MMKLYEILLMVIVLVVCTSETPHIAKEKPKTYISVIDPLDALRLEYNCYKNEFSKAEQQAYISTKELKEALQ